MRRALPTALIAGGVVVGVLLLRRRLRIHRVHTILRSSHELYQTKQYEEALTAAKHAQTVALTEVGENSSAHLQTTMHLAAVHAAMRQNDLALATLDDCDAIIAARADGQLASIPVLHARAEVHEASRQIARAMHALESAREIRYESLGDNHLDFAFSCFNLAGLLVREASEALIMYDSARAQKLERAISLTLEASSVASKAHAPEEAEGFVLAMLELVVSSDKLADLKEAAPHIAKLREREKNFF
eukprot:CAMPEP_0183361020 /NCGR_PEP_ID=MMETSP0164_2-20130417/56202_1 /TAXON_ID=221442 /ORGANISM="Coccolithus pelagicus ssp braarudi, Strain PLY182g" /LENGTH=245 /DNA_ID=CAMNT_0025535473 /DNA_START=53 /DNA_END=790 /DNA_ORIENTATION=+